MAQEDNAKRLQEAQKLARTKPQEAEATYKDILKQGPGASDVAVRNYEGALLGLGELYRDQKRVDDLAQLVHDTRSVLSSFAKAKTAKLGELSNHSA